MLRFNGAWRFTPPLDGQWKNQSIPLEAVGDFYTLITKTTTQGNRQEILEHFKGAFCASVGSRHVWSSDEGWAETDLQNTMNFAAENAPLFIEAFYDACDSLSNINKDYFAPDAALINAVCQRHNVGYEVRPPNLILLETEIPANSDSASQNNNKVSDTVRTSSAPILALPSDTSQEFGQDGESVITVTTQRRLRVFLCHSSSDKQEVRKLYHRLCSEGIDPWLDEENLLPGQEWQQEIPKAVRNSDVVLVCLSPTAVSKAGYLQREIRYALDVADEQPEGRIFLIPIKLDDCEIPDRLARWQWVNLFDERGYERLMLALRSRSSNL
jgi:hypothetical protein